MSGNTRNGNGWRENRWRVVGWGVAAIMLLVPLIAMQFTDEVDWDLTDFIVFGAMLAFVGGALELAARMRPGRKYRAAAGVALVAAFLLTWINLAVGIIGNEGNPANLMYFGVLVVGIIGAAIARFRPRGMARAMVATAIAQALVAVIALFLGLGYTFVVTGFFVTLWLFSAWLFKAASEETASQA